MKVQSWFTLLTTIIVGGGCLVFKFLNAMAGDVIDYLWVAIFAVLIVKGLNISFSKEKNEIDQKHAKICKKVYRKLFGKMALAGQYGALILCLLACGSAKLYPNQEWLILVFSLSALVYQICLIIAFRKHMKGEE